MNINDYEEVFRNRKRLQKLIHFWVGSTLAQMEDAPFWCGCLAYHLDQIQINPTAYTV